MAANKNNAEVSVKMSFEMQAPSWVHAGQKVVCIKLAEAIPQPIVGEQYTIDEVKALYYLGKFIEVGITLKELPTFGDEEFDGPNTVLKYYSWKSFRPVDTAEEDKKSNIEELV